MMQVRGCCNMVVLFIAACNVSERPDARRVLQVEGEPAPVMHNYPHERWRLATPYELERTLLVPSHILIRHAESEPTEVPFELCGWSIMPPLPERSRRDALALALRLARRLKAAPDEFSEVARSFSEDPTTKGSGGSLGSTAALQLAPWPVVLDALSALKEDEVSEVIETSFGYHIFQRGRLPSPETVAGRRLVVGYEEAGCYRMSRRHEGTPDRQRTDALELAKRVQAELEKNPERFDELTAQYSEHRDAERGGDLGVWFTREPTVLNRELGVLLKLPIGGISVPVDTPNGFAILQRTTSEERRRFAADFVSAGFSAGDIESRRAAEASVRATRKAFSDDPSKWETNPLVSTQQWQVGRAPLNFVEHLQHVPIGGVSEPVESESFFAILRRLDPKQSPSPLPVLFELPAPTNPDLDYWIPRFSEPAIAALVEEMRGLGSSLVGREQPALLLSYEGAHETLIVGWRDTVDISESRSQLLKAMLQSVQRSLSSVAFDSYVARLNAAVTKLLDVEPQLSQ